MTFFLGSPLSDWFHIQYLSKEASERSFQLNLLWWCKTNYGMQLNNLWDVQTSVEAVWIWIIEIWSWNIVTSFNALLGFLLFFLAFSSFIAFNAAIRSLNLKTDVSVRLCFIVQMWVIFSIFYLIEKIIMLSLTESKLNNFFANEWNFDGSGIVNVLEWETIPLFSYFSSFTKQTIDIAF